ncbi:uncharacterized protein LOC109859512 [Pseudomyrmex gracilis]|uniref:uncharacterized protein LOC109859512 n=1 Tax=Pseudomyrmex gracilis TaxID=219809 RepID=UPI00099596B5|nr:uncharacterized protein LOC109859512 [Pseudomyrmex gracilis]
MSRHPSMLLVTEYFIDKERYLYLILLHTHMALIIGWFSMMATGALLLAYFQHICGMFQIASYRLEQAMMINSLQTIGVQKKNYIYKKMICAIDMHRKALKLSDSLISNFNTMFFLLIIVGVSCASLTCFRVFNALTHGFDIEKVLTPMAFICFHFLYMSVGNYVAQDVTDHNHNVFVTVYCIQWYLAPLHVQQLVLFLLQKGRKPYQLSCGFGIVVGSLETAATWYLAPLHVQQLVLFLLQKGRKPYQLSCGFGIFVGSLETAATLFSTSVSYFTVLYSTQQ